MANYWAIAIGINQYRFLSPLSYAQRDAELLHEFLIHEAVFAPRQCWLLSDHITVASSDLRFPTAQNIQTRIAQYQQQVKPGDVLLCFFSGYGIHAQGQDYLLPIEADPKQVAISGIAVESLLKALKAVPTQNIVLILDANRSQLGLEHGGFGAQTAQLAQNYGIATLLSCQPNQFSHEPLTLRQGIFTTTLVATLQEKGCITLEQLVASVGERLPKLSEQCWRPRQDLLAVVPPHLRYQLIVPDVKRRPGAADHRLVGVPFGTDRSAGGAYSNLKLGNSLKSSLLLLSQTGSQVAQTMATWFNSKSSAQPMLAIPSEMSSTESLSNVAVNSSAVLSDDFFWRRLLAQGGLIAAILLFGVILRNSGALINSSQTSDSLAPTAQMPTASSAPTTPNPTAPEEAIVVPDPALLLQSAQAAFQAQQYEESNRLLAQIPAGQRTPEQTQLLEQTNRELLNKGKMMLIRTRESRTENQVSDFVEAIKMARLIKADQPLYEEAQQNLDRWSRVIMDMAQGRAQRSNGSSPIDAANNYGLAISAANLVPDDQVKVQQQADQAITQWSQKILDLANERAANNELDLAIQIGELIPPNTPVYAAAQEAIANWRNLPAPVIEKPAPVIEAPAPVIEEPASAQSLEEPVLEESISEEPIAEPILEEPAPEPVAEEPIPEEEPSY